jgi:RNA polymerase sigma-70 factor (ECF subfamily)
MSAEQWQTEQFEGNRTHLKAVAYRMLGSIAEADDAVQEAWLRFNRSDATALENTRAWLTTVVSRVCLDMLRVRQARREQLVDEWLPESIVTIGDSEDDPEQQVLMADSVGVALLVVLETLSPAERLAFVLHDLFGLPFEEIAPIIDRNAAAARQLASRARRRVRGAEPGPMAHSLAEQRTVVEAFLAASREGSFDALLAILDPDVVLRADRGQNLEPGPIEVTGGPAVAALILRSGAPVAHLARPAIIDGQAGAFVSLPDRLLSVVKFTVARGRVTAMDLVLDPDTLRTLRI